MNIGKRAGMMKTRFSKTENNVTFYVKGCAMLVLQGCVLSGALPGLSHAQRNSGDAAAAVADQPAVANSQGTAAPAGKRGKPALTVRLTQAETATLPTFIHLNGNVAAWQDMVVGSELSGVRLQEVHAQIGDRVKKGQLLAQHNTESIEVDVALAQAALAEAQAAAAEAARNADALRGLSDKAAVSGLQQNQVLTQELTTQARAQSAKAQLDMQNLRLRHARVVAPDDGVVTARTAVVGAVPMAGQELFRLVRKGRLEWRGEATVQEMSRIKTGMKVLLTSPEGKALSATVRSVSPVVDTGSRTALVYADLSDNTDLKAGTYLRGRIQLAQSAAMLLPEAAVVQRDGFRYVFVINADQTVQQVKVETGRRDAQRVEIVSGLAQDARVVSTGAGFLADGDVVRVAP